MGLTASGKTDSAVRLAEALNGEVISVDSELVYRGLKIGAAKPTDDEKAGIPHHLMDIRDPWDPYSAADFARDAQKLVERIIDAGRVPILAGGTMLYFKAVLEGLSTMPESDAGVREQIEQQAAVVGWPAMHKELAQADPVAAERIHPNHSQRICRALEVWRVSGKPISQWQEQSSLGLLESYDCLQFGFMPENRAALHENIALRLKRMLDSGFVAEVETLRQDPRLHKDLPSMRSVGYRQVWEYLDGDYDFTTMCEKSLAATRQLAKRQMTWMRSWNGLITVRFQNSNGNSRELDEIVQELLGFYQ